MSSMKGTILIVDDEAAFLEFMSSVLNIAGYEVVTANDGATALVIAREVRLDAIITDMVMPDMSGAELVTRLRIGGSDAPIIAMTGHPEGDGYIAQVAQTTRSDFVLYKPFTASEICMAVELVMKNNKADLTSSPRMA
jgi:two-component system, OmpR family, response regulator